MRRLAQAATGFLGRYTRIAALSSFETTDTRMQSPYPVRMSNPPNSRFLPSPELRHRTRDHAADTASVVRVGQCGLSWGGANARRIRACNRLCRNCVHTRLGVPKLCLDSRDQGLASAVSD
jgi:hypothetical protein